MWDASDLSSPVAERLDAHSITIHSVTFSPDGTHIATVGWDSALREWDAASDLSSPLLERLDAQIELIHSVAYSPDGTRIVTGGGDGALRVWDAASCCRFVYPTSYCSPRCKETECTNKVQQDNCRAETLDDFGDVTSRCRWTCDEPDLSSPLLERLDAHSDDVNSVAYSPEGGHIATGGSDGALRVWNASDLSSPMLERLNAGVRIEHIQSVAYSPDGSRIATGDSDGALRVWDASDLSSPLLERLDAHSGIISSVVYSPDGSRIATGGWDNALRVWDASDLSSPRLEELNAHSSGIRSVAYSPDGPRIATCGEDRALRVWDAWDAAFLLRSPPPSPPPVAPPAPPMRPPPPRRPPPSCYDARNRSRGSCPHCFETAAECAVSHGEAWPRGCDLPSCLTKGGPGLAGTVSLDGVMTWCWGMPATSHRLPALYVGLALAVGTRRGAMCMIRATAPVGRPGGREAPTR